MDPSGTVGAARQLGVPVTGAVVRVLAAAELVLGGAVLAVESRVLAGMVALSFAGFAVFTAVALARDLPIDSCGCLGRLETPPSWPHVGVLVVAAAGSAAAAIAPAPALLERLGDGGVAFALAAVALTVVAVALLRRGRRPTGDPTSPRR